MSEYLQNEFKKGKLTKTKDKQISRKIGVATNCHMIVMSWITQPMKLLLFLKPSESFLSTLSFFHLLLIKVETEIKILHPTLLL